MPGSNEYSMLSSQPSISTGSSAGGLSSGSAPVANAGSSSGLSIGDILGFIANPIGSIFNFFANRSLSDRRNRQAVEQWKRENEYNLPKNQIKRLKDAGLNPALMYENGASGLISAQSPEMTMGAPSNLSVLDPLTAAQVRNIEADTKSKLDANDRENEKQPFNVLNLRAQTDLLKKEVSKLSSDEQLNYAQKSYIEAKKIFEGNLAKEQMELWNSQEDLNESLRLQNQIETIQTMLLFNLKKQGLEYANAEILSRVGVNKADEQRILKIVEKYDDYYNLEFNKTYVQGYDAATRRKEYKFMLDKFNNWDSHLLQAQYYLLVDQYKRPGRYRSTSVGFTTPVLGVNYSN